MALSMLLDLDYVYIHSTIQELVFLPIHHIEKMQTERKEEKDCDRCIPVVRMVGK